MVRIKPVFRYFKRPFKRVKLYIKQKAGWLEQPKIVVFKGYGNDKEFFIGGRVVEDAGLTKPTQKQYFLKNILTTIKRFSSDEIAGVGVKATFHQSEKHTQTDEFGYFHFKFELNSYPDDNQKNWFTVHLELTERISDEEHPASATGEFRRITDQDERIIISDIDDTIIVSHSTQILKKLRLMLFRNAHGRSPFPGVARFYAALKKGADGKRTLPFFYVSSSEWNLYDLLEDAFLYHQIPKGIFMLKKLEHSIYKFWKSGGGNHEHKYENIKTLLKFFESQSFILIGDSGQRDPFIYKRLANEFPDRIESIYIRKVKKRADREQYNLNIGKANIPYIEIADTQDAYHHAVEQGFISESSTHTPKT